MTENERAERLLRAIGDVDERYIAEAAGEDGAQDKKRGAVINFKSARRWAAAAAACLVLAIAGAAVIRTKNESSGAPGDTDVMVGSPMQEVSGIDEAEALTGFGMELPQGESPYDNIVVTVIDGELIDASYQTADGSDEGYSLRKAKGSGDISGDYNEYESCTVVSVGEYTVTLRGDGESVSSAVWESGGYSYALNAQNHPLTAEEAERIISSVR